MQFTLTTLLLLFVVLASSVGAFGLWGIPLTILIVPLGFAFRAGKTRNGRVGCFVIFFGVLACLLFLFLPILSGMLQTDSFYDGLGCHQTLSVIGEALRKYHDAYGSFPPAYVNDEHGKPMHSWRILVWRHSLPHACGAYDFKQPWNAPTNIAFFPSTDSPLSWGDHYFAVIGPGTAWPGTRGSKLDEFTDGPEQTILLVEAIGRDVPWCKPCDIALDEALGGPNGPTTVPRSNHGVTHTGVLCYFFKDRPIAGYALMASGWVMEIPKHIPREDLAALLSINGGEKIDFNALLKRYEPPLVESLRWDHVVGLPLFLVSVVWFWLRLAADAKLTGKTSKEQDS